jgi:hypothetical protein
MAAVGGTVVMTARFEVFGFGSEIFGNFPDPLTVAKTCDIEGRNRIMPSGNAKRGQHRSKE